MDCQMLLCAGIMLLGVFLASVAQVILKFEAIKEHKNMLNEYLNIRVIIAYAIMIFCTILSVVAYRVVPISMGSVLDSTSYIYVTILGVVFFKEKLSSRRAVALVLIISGIIVYSILG